MDQETKKLVDNVTNFLLKQNTIILNEKIGPKRATILFAFNGLAGGVWNIKKLGKKLNVPHEGSSGEYLNKILDSLQADQSRTYIEFKQAVSLISAMEKQWKKEGAKTISQKLKTLRK